MSRLSSCFCTFRLLDFCQQTLSCSFFSFANAAFCSIYIEEMELAETSQPLFLPLTATWQILQHTNICFCFPAQPPDVSKSFWVLCLWNVLIFDGIGVFLQGERSVDAEAVQRVKGQTMRWYNICSAIFCSVDLSLTLHNYQKLWEVDLFMEWLCAQLSMHFDPQKALIPLRLCMIVLVCDCKR